MVAAPTTGGARPTTTAALFKEAVLEENTPSRGGARSDNASTTASVASTTASVSSNLSSLDGGDVSMGEEGCDMSMLLGS